MSADLLVNSDIRATIARILQLFGHLLKAKINTQLKNQYNIDITSEKLFEIYPSIFDNKDKKKILKKMKLKTLVRFIDEGKDLYLPKDDPCIIIVFY